MHALRSVCILNDKCMCGIKPYVLTMPLSQTCPLINIVFKFGSVDGCRVERRSQPPQAACDTRSRGDRESDVLCPCNRHYAVEIFSCWHVSAPLPTRTDAFLTPVRRTRRRVIRRRRRHRLTGYTGKRRAEIQNSPRIA